MAAPDEFMSSLRSDDPMVAVELRPPRLGIATMTSMDLWIGMNATARHLATMDTPLFLTDGAVGTREEENLHHLVSNLSDDVSRHQICPFLTTKHTLQYCMWYTARAVDAGCPALTVLGGDRVGAARCVPHGYVLRQHLRERFPDLALGGWANPHRDASKQVDYLLDDGFNADFFLTQLVSHHDRPAVERFMKEAHRRGADLPAVFGVFFYRSAKPKTLARLGKFFPVPAEALTREFAKPDVTAEQVCANTIRSLMNVGASKFYVSNLHPDRAGEQLTRVKELAGL